MKETIKLYEDGEYKTYERDMAKIPLTVEDWMNASELDIAQHNYSTRMAEDKPMKAKDAQDLVKADVKFVVNYFRNQFTPDQAMKGIAPRVMVEEFNRWYNQSAGALDIGNEKGDQKKITVEELKKSRKKVLALFRVMQEKFGYNMKDILSMRGPEFKTFIDSFGENKVEEKPKLTTIDQAFPQFFTDPFAKRKGSKS